MSEPAAGGVDAVVVAAGASSRFGGMDKLSAELCGKPVLAWSIAALSRANCIGRVVVVTSPANVAWAEGLALEAAGEKFGAVVAGGARRRDSVEAGLRACHSRYVAIHDGARPLATTELVERVVAAALAGPGAIAAVPVVDTIKRVRDGRIVGHPERGALWAAQTPQVVLRQAWLDAARAGDGDETDDAAMLARLGLELAVVEGGIENIKITRPLDLEVARLILERQRPP